MMQVTYIWSNKVEFTNSDPIPLKRSIIIGVNKHQVRTKRSVALKTFIGILFY